MRISNDLKMKLRQLAHEDDRSLSDFILVTMKKLVEKSEEEKINNIDEKP